MVDSGGGCRAGRGQQGVIRWSPFDDVLRALVCRSDKARNVRPALAVASRSWLGSVGVRVEFTEEYR